MTTVGQILASFTFNLLFFSNDVKTTTIAVAVTGSLCCSIVYALVHLVTKLHQTNISKLEKSTDVIFSKDSLTINHLKNQHQKPSRSYYTAYYTSKKHIPCSRCGDVSNDELCAFGLCSFCCLHQTCAVHTKNWYHIGQIGPEYIDLSKSCMEYVPDRLGFIGAQLTFLNLSDNKLKVLPDDLGCLIGLQDLHLHNNLLTTIPITLGSLPALCYLDLRNNNISSIPESLWKVSTLKYLNLDSNDLQTLSEMVGCLINLQILCLGSNNIEHIPFSVAKLIYLQILSFPNNPIAVLPEAISRLINLEELDASNCLLLKLPKDIGFCRSLQKLLLRGNRLRHLPYSIGQLEKLVELNVCDNNIPVFPSSMEDMKVLLFNVDKNPLVTYDTCREYFFRINDFSQTDVPPLKEISARKAFEFNQNKLDILPKTLQEMMRNYAKCVQCWQPVFQHRLFHIRMGPIGKYPSILPLLLIFCSSSCRKIVNKT